jgi:class 3 adenylate cyclase
MCKAGGEIEMKRDQLIEKIYGDYTEQIYNGKLLDSVEDYIRNYVKVVNEGIEKIKKYIGREVVIEFDDRNAFAHIRIKENSINFYRKQDRIEVSILRNGDKRDDQIIVVENICKSRMYEKSIQEAMDKYINIAFQ